MGGGSPSDSWADGDDCWVGFHHGNKSPSAPVVLELGMKDLNLDSSFREVTSKHDLSVGMVGGSSSDSWPDEDSSWVGVQSGNQSPPSPVVLESGMKDLNLESSIIEDILPAAREPTFATRGPTLSTYGSRGPGVDLSSVKSRRCTVDGFQNGKLEDYGIHQLNGRKDLSIYGSEAPVGFTTSAEETVQDLHLSDDVSTDLQQCPLAPTTLQTSQSTRGSLHPVRKKIFKVMQIENDNQDLSFVEKVILSRDEIFSLCNDITPESARTSEGRRSIDFGGLNTKSMKVVGFFGSKDVMRDIFQNLMFTEQGDVWMQIHKDTLAPGLYTCVHGDSLYVFYWHQGHSLPKATRKDMSCNFIRYVFDLCDTVCVCLEGENLQSSLSGSVPRFSKRQRNQRLKISLVKASEDSVKVAAGFSLKNLPFQRGNGLRGKSQQEMVSFDLTSSHEYKLSEGQSRVALLVSSPRPPELSSVKNQKEISVNDFPAFIQKWTGDTDYSLDLRKLSDEDFLVFIHCAKLNVADDYDRLVDLNKKRKEEERKDILVVDQLVEEQQESLSRCLESFINDLLKNRYSWEENLTLSNSSVHHGVTPEDLCASKAGQQQHSGEGLIDLHLDSLESPSDDLVRMKSESPFPRSEDAQNVTQDRLDQHENDIYNLLFDKDSSQRLVFPHSLVYIDKSIPPRISSRKVSHRVFTIASAGHSKTISSKFAPILCGDKVTLTCINDSPVQPKTCTFRLSEDADYRGPILTDAKVTCKLEGGRGLPEMVTLKAVHGTGDLSAWLSQQAQMEIRPLSQCALLLTAIHEKLDVSTGHEFEMTVELTRRILASDYPLKELQSVLTKPADLEFAKSKWEELREMTEIPDQKMNITDLVANLCVDRYKSLRGIFQTKIVTQSKRYSAPLLARRIRKQCSENYNRLEAKLREEELAFLASQKEELSRRKHSSGPLTLTIEACHLRENPGYSLGNIMKGIWSKSNEDGRKISIRYIQQELERESITWRGLELAPMKEDLDRLITDSEYTFSPYCSESKELIDLDPSSHILSRVFFLKSGQMLVFVIGAHDHPKELIIYLCPKLGIKLTANNCIQRIKRGFDLIAFDERSRFIAFYDSTISVIKSYRFDDEFLHMDWAGVDIHLGEYSIGRVVWMDFVTGKNEIVFIDDLNRARLCEVNQPGMVKSGNFHVGHGPIVKACVTSQGSCLLVLRNVKSVEQVTKVSDRKQNSDHEAGIESESDSSLEEECLIIELYKLGDTIQHFSSIPLDLKIKDWSRLVTGLASYASQMHLLIFNCDSPSMITSKVIKISLASEVCQLQQVARPEEAEETMKNPGPTESGPVLDYIYQVFEKYAISPPLSSQSRGVHLCMVLKGPAAANSSPSLNDKCREYVNSSLDRLKRDKGKDFSALEVQVSVHDASRFQSFKDLPWSTDEGSWSTSAVNLEIPMGEWMTRLVCLVPIQIARAEHNALKPMVDGLQLDGNVDYADAISLANVVRFGLYETVFDSWMGPVKVISSMGKQSSGKSYLLNHLSGSLLDVAGGRCTDGVWMTLRQANGCLYVLLDFEGLGSFERSEQEDMLLSMLNAAISNLTIFNKKDFHLDKETEAIFERFQNGVSLVKTDAKLFRGLFYMAIKDVDISDVEDLKSEFFSKISQICSKSQDNFLTRMYGGSVEIAAMPSFNRPEFHESIAVIAQTVEELEPSYLSGRSFLLDLKLIIAQITTKDWSPIDSKRVALRLNLLRKHLESAISVGCIFSGGKSKPLMQFEDYVDIPDEPLIVNDMDFPIGDTELELTAVQEKKVTGDIVLGLVSTFKRIVNRKGEKDEDWHSFLEKFIRALVLRRKTRVLQWIASNTSDFTADGDIQKLQLEAMAILAELQQNLLLCSCKCERCFLRCVREKGHSSIHSCMGDHRCVAICTYCLDEESTLGAGPCDDVAGHDGPHDCKVKSHTCGKCCTYSATSSNCNGYCSKKSGHTGDHICNSKQHTCNQICSLPYCKNPCVSPIDVGNHEIHACHEKFCPHRCTMTGCNRTCSTEDHFHGIEPEVTHHFCGAEHACPAKCEHKGNCEVLTEVSKKTQTFTGQRGTFDYVLVSEQNGNRKGCCIVIPPDNDRHEGPHSHSSNPDSVHFCQTRCPSCSYFCTRPMEHGGLHSTTHGNMRDVNFVAESEEIDILDRKYAWGESGVAEMCQMHCRAQGRGHIHLIHCPANKDGGACRKLFDGAQHEVRRYGPEFDTPKDEMTHASYWEYVRFEDPCSAEEKSQFSLCNHQCKSDEHKPASGGSSTSALQNISYCTESLWHQPVPKIDLVKFGTGYITDDGHHFSCVHNTNTAVHVIFIIDRSGSMEFEDIRPTMTKFASSHDNRLGCVYEAILRFIRTRLASCQEDLASVILFADTASTIISLQEMKESLVDELLRHYPQRSTNYSSGLQNAEQILSLAMTDARLSRKRTIIIFLSDGGNNGGSDPLHHIGAMKALDPRLQLHTIMFGNDPARKILEDMAKAGDGTFEVSLDEVQLSQRFEGLAKSLRPQVASLL